MDQKLTVQNTFIRFLIPLGLIILMVLIASSSAFTKSPELLATAITVDLLLTIPFLYFLLIGKTNIPKTTVVPFIFLGVLVATFSIPSENQYYLNLFKTWAIPLIEITVASYVIYHLRKLLRSYDRSNDQTTDFFILLKEACSKILPKAFVIPVVTEIAVFYYGFVYWKPKVLKCNEFSYHKNSGTITLLAAIILIVAVETVVFHKILANWSIIAAWIFTLLSIYSGIQLFGFLKAMLKRPIILDDSALYLRYGIMGEATIAYHEIESIEISSREIKLDNEIRSLSFLASLETHNMIITFNRTQRLTSLYGITKTFKTLVLYIDEKDKFKEKLLSKLQNTTHNE